MSSGYKNNNMFTTHQSNFPKIVHPRDRNILKDSEAALNSATCKSSLVKAYEQAVSVPLPERDGDFDNEPPKDFEYVTITDRIPQLHKQEDVRFMSEPMLFIECATQGWKVNDEAKKFLADLNMPLVIVSIVGPYRTGKSYLLNRFADVKKAKGFELGSTVQSKTKGIWMWCRPHPSNPGECMMLLDTEGLHDAEKGDSNHDNQIFALAILISSVFLYNTVGRIDNRAIEEMDFITHITDYIHVRSGQDQDSDENAAGYEDYQQIFPTFVWVLRDFMLSLEMDGERITANEYLGKMLELKPMPKHLRDRKERNRINDYNEPRERISSVFQRRECFVLRRPVDDNESLSRVNDIPECELNQEFVEQVDELCDFIKNECSTKHFSTKDGNIEINGPKLLGLAEMYTGTIQSGSVPCVERAIKLLAEMENTNAIDKAMELYRSIMSHHVDNSALSADTFESIHQNAMIESRKVFDDGRKFDNDGSYEERFQVKIKNEYCNYKERCERDREIMIQRAIEHGRIIYLQKMQNTIDDMPYSLEKLYLHESACLIEVFSTIREELSFLSDDEWEKERELFEKIYHKELEFFKLKNESIENRLHIDVRERIERMMMRYDIYMKRDLPCGVDLIETRHQEMEAEFRHEIEKAFPSIHINTWNQLLVSKLEGSLEAVHLENEKRLKQSEYEWIAREYNHMKTDLESKQKQIKRLQYELNTTHRELDTTRTDLTLIAIDSYTKDEELERARRYNEEQEDQQRFLRDQVEEEKTIHSDLQGHIKTVDTNTQLRQNMIQHTEETYKVATSNLERLKQYKNILQDPASNAAALPPGVKFHKESDWSDDNKKSRKKFNNWTKKPNENSRGAKSTNVRARVSQIEKEEKWKKEGRSGRGRAKAGAHLTTNRPAFGNSRQQNQRDETLDGQFDGAECDSLELNQVKEHLRSTNKEKDDGHKNVNTLAYENQREAANYCNSNMYPNIEEDPLQSDSRLGITFQNDLQPIHEVNVTPRGSENQRQSYIQTGFKYVFGLYKY